MAPMSTILGSPKKIGRGTRGAVDRGDDADVYGSNRPHVRAMGSTGAKSYDFNSHPAGPPLKMSFIWVSIFRLAGGRPEAKKYRAPLYTERPYIQSVPIYRASLYADIEIARCRLQPRGRAGGPRRAVRQSER